MRTNLDIEEDPNYPIVSPSKKAMAEYCETCKAMVYKPCVVCQLRKYQENRKKKKKRMEIINPEAFYRLCWPDSNLYDKQIEILYSLRDNYETVVPAGNGLGKDYITAVACLWWMCSRMPARVVTTSVKGAQLEDVLWGEIRHLINTSAVDMPLQYNHLKIRQLTDGELEGKGELVGQVCREDEALLGRHLPNDIPRTLVCFDEASAIRSGVYETSLTWAHRVLVIGNPFPCENFFKKAVKEGDAKSTIDDTLRRKVIKIKATDSPNIQMAFTEVLKGDRKPLEALIRTEEQPYGIYGEEEYRRLTVLWKKNGKPNPPLQTLIPGLITYPQYVERRTTWDAMLQCISVDGEFYEGPEAKLFPPEWLNASEIISIGLSSRKRIAKTMGIDAAEGGDNTAWAIVDELGVIDLISKKTHDTSVITSDTLWLMRKYNITAGNVLFDVGGGGKQHADRLRSQGFNVRTVAFGGAATPERKRGLTTMEQKKMQDEVKYAFKNRRAEMYFMLRLMLDPSYTLGFGIPSRFLELRRQMEPIPMQLDGEGKIVLAPKYKKDANSTMVTLTELIGHSPDELDALVLAVYGLKKKQRRSVARALVS